MRLPAVGLMVGWVLALVAACSCATNGFPKEFDEKPTARFRPAENLYYGPPDPALRALVAFNHKNGVPNHFCVVGYRWPSDNLTVWVHWQEEQRLLLWRGNSDPEMRRDGIIYAQVDLKLGKDTVESGDEIRGSTYLTTRAWWEAVAKDCRTHGEQFTVPPFPSP
jgi:hypothetical protein